MFTFYKIRAPDADDPRRWAARMSGAYGFNYAEKFTRTTILAWPIDSKEELEKSLLDDGIEFISFETDDIDKVLGV